MRNLDEPCVYKKASGSNIVFLVLYVDDILIMGNSMDMMMSPKAWLSRVFSIKDLGDATYILGIRLYRNRVKKLIGFSQSLYIEKMLKSFSIVNSKKGSCLSELEFISLRRCALILLKREIV